MNFIVIKRNGMEEEFSLQKLSKVIDFASEDLDIDMNKFLNEFQFTFKNKITTKEIQKNLIHAAYSCIYDPETKTINKNFSILGNRFRLLDFWKEFKLQREKEYNTLTDDVGLFKKASDWIKHLEKYVKFGVYDERILRINKEILKRLYTYIKRVNNEEFENYSYPHFLWNNFHYQTDKFIKSYIIKYKGVPIETFEEALLLISIMGFYYDYKKDKEQFIENVKKFYKHLVKYHFIPATPQLLNLRRKNGNLSSCNIFDVHDNLESIYYSLMQAALLSKRAGGIGIYLGRMRPSASEVNNTPGVGNHIALWARLFNDTMVAVNQSGIRKGSATLALPIWHKDVIEFAKSRAPLGEARYKNFDIFPQIIIPNIFIEKLLNDEDFYLIDLHEVKQIDESLDLVEAIDEELTEKYEKIVQLIKEGKIKNYKKMKALSIAVEIMKSITASGLPYLVFEDNINKYSNFKEKIYCANLCVESFSPFKNTNPENKKPSECVDSVGYAHSCNLFSLNLPRLYEDGILFDDSKLEEVMNLVVRYMDNIITITSPPIEEVKNHNDLYRTIGIGYVGFADLMVKLTVDENKLYTYKFTRKSANDKKLYKEYKDNLTNLIKRVFGRVAFYSILASIKLARERGKFSKYEETKWKDGILLGQIKIPYHETFGYEELDKILDFFGLPNTESNKDLIKYIHKQLTKFDGIRNSMLLNCPPNTSTSVYAGVSASIFPLYNTIQKESQKNADYITFPRYVEYQFYYDIYQNMTLEDIDDIIYFVSTVQKYIDAGISFEYPINLNLIKRDDIPKYITRFFVKAAKSGIKALYYGRTISSQGKELNTDSNQKDKIESTNYANNETDVYCESCAN